LPPSFRFPPLREGNRERRAYSVPPACRGNLKEGVINCCFFVNFGLAIGIIGRDAPLVARVEARYCRPRSDGEYYIGAAFTDLSRTDALRLRRLFP
jgi:hypothetical protein